MGSGVQKKARDNMKRFGRFIKIFCWRLLVALNIDCYNWDEFIQRSLLALATVVALFGFLTIPAAYIASLGLSWIEGYALSFFACCFLGIYAGIRVEMDEAWAESKKVKRT